MEMSTERNNQQEERPSFALKQKWQIGVHVVVSTLAVLAIANVHRTHHAVTFLCQGATAKKKKKKKN